MALCRAACGNLRGTLFRKHTCLSFSNTQCFSTATFSFSTCIFPSFCLVCEPSLVKDALLYKVTKWQLHFTNKHTERWFSGSTSKLPGNCHFPESLAPGPLTVPLAYFWVVAVAVYFQSFFPLIESSVCTQKEKKVLVWCHSKLLTGKKKHNVWVENTFV